MSRIAPATKREVAHQPRGSEAIDRIPASMRMDFAERQRDVKSLTWEFSGLGRIRTGV
jgi:hypothetical protein